MLLIKKIKFLPVLDDKTCKEVIAQHKDMLEHKSTRLIVILNAIRRNFKWMLF